MEALLPWIFSFRQILICGLILDTTSEETEEKN